MTAPEDAGSVAEIEAETTPELLRVSALLFAPHSCSLLITLHNGDCEKHLPRFTYLGLILCTLKIKRNDLTTTYLQQLIASHFCCRNVHRLLLT